MPSLPCSVKPSMSFGRKPRRRKLFPLDYIRTCDDDGNELLKQNNEMGRMTVFGGNSHPSFVNAVCEYLSIRPGKIRATHLHNGESSVELEESVRGNDVYVIQSGCGDMNNNLMELLLIINACRNASAGQITAVIPCFPYAHQDINPKSRTPVTAKLVANMLSSAGCDHVITMDLHASQIQGFFDIPVDNLYAEPLITKWIRENVQDYKAAVIVSPDAGGAKRVASVADKLGLEFAIIHAGRRRRNHRGATHSEQTPVTGSSTSSRMSARGYQGEEFNGNHPQHKEHSHEADDKKISSDNLILVGNVADRVTIILDDLSDTGLTFSLAAQKLREEGAKEVYCIVTHGILSGPGVDHVNKTNLKKFVCSNTVPQMEHQRACPTLEVFDVAAMFGEAIRRTHNGESVSHLFKTSK